MYSYNKIIHLFLYRGSCVYFEDVNEESTVNLNGLGRFNFNSCRKAIYLGKNLKTVTIPVEFGLGDKNQRKNGSFFFFSFFLPVDCTVLFVIQCFYNPCPEMFRYKASSFKNSIKTMISGSYHCFFI